LGAELIRQGHEVGIIAIRDKYVSSVFTGNQESETLFIPILRIPLIYNTRQRFTNAKNWIDKFDPEWLSLQYVPFTFQTKGLPFWLSKHLKFVAGKRNWHIMFHETWVGSESKLDIKKIIISFLQKEMFRLMLSKVRPVIIHTHLPLFKKRLQQLRYSNIKALPLFSNTPVSLKEKSKDYTNFVFRIGFFSKFETSKSVLDFLSILGEQLIENGLEPEVLIIGGKIEETNIYKQNIENISIYKNRVIQTGFLQPVELSEKLQSCSLGITPVPRHVLGKSASVATFLFHGVPIAAPNHHLQYDDLDIGFFLPNLTLAVMLQPDLNSFQKAKEATSKARDEIKLSTIVQCFIADLQNV
ncbi:MAG: hypothetical protein M3004_03450, partial [Bacteroidota bacterium]|nr:hypothetical protein [Bacteroidota bacterium]